MPTKVGAAGLREMEFRAIRQRLAGRDGCSEDAEKVVAEKKGLQP
jgi:hypothetical protein